MLLLMDDSHPAIVLRLLILSCLQPSIVAEVQTMKLLKHPNILPLYAAFLDDDQLWMVMPYVAGGSASDIMRRTSPNVSLAGHPAHSINSIDSTDCCLRNHTGR